MRQLLWKCSLGVLMAVGVAGCASAVEPVDQAETPAPASPEVPMNPTLESITEAMLEDAARRTGIASANLKVESAMAATWPDGSLGCPQPGMNYTMALVPGYRIKVRAGEQVLDYHASRRGDFTLCPAGMSDEPSSVERM